MKWSVLLFVLLSLTWAQSRFTIQKVFQFKKLVQCRALGYDTSIRDVIVDIVLGKDDMTRVEQCVYGCQIGWALAGDGLATFEIGTDPLDTFTVGVLKRLYKYTKQCAGKHFFSNKCSMGKTLPLCVYDKYSEFVIKTYAPWWPDVKDAIDTLVDAVPLLRRFRNAFRKIVTSLLVDHIVRRWLDGVITKAKRRLARGLAYALIIKLIKKGLSTIKSIVIPIPLPKFIKKLIPVLNGGLAIQLGGIAAILGGAIINQIERLRKLHALIFRG